MISEYYVLKRNLLFLFKHLSTKKSKFGLRASEKMLKIPGAKTRSFCDATCLQTSELGDRATDVERREATAKNPSITAKVFRL